MRRLCRRSPAKPFTAGAVAGGTSKPAMPSRPRAPSAAAHPNDPPTACGARKLAWFHVEHRGPPVSIDRAVAPASKPRRLPPRSLRKSPELSVSACQRPAPFVASSRSLRSRPKCSPPSSRGPAGVAAVADVAVAQLGSDAIAAAHGRRQSGRPYLSATRRRRGAIATVRRVSNSLSRRPPISSTTTAIGWSAPATTRCPTSILGASASPDRVGHSHDGWHGTFTPASGGTVDRIGGTVRRRRSRDQMLTPRPPVGRLAEVESLVAVGSR